MPRSPRRRTHRRHPVIPAALLSALLATPSEGQAQGSFEGWVELYESAQIDRLGNEYRLDALCPRSDPAGFSECFERVMAPLVETVPLYEAPDPTSPILGEIITVAVPSGTLTAHYRWTDDRSVTLFTPDLYLADWGYGPYFHHTVAERTGDWVRLPPGPWPTTVWILRGNVDARLAHIRAGDIVATTDGRSWMVETAEPDRLLVRDEIPADFWCEAGDPPPVEPGEPVWIARAELLDDRGHLVVRPKYMKGC